MTKELFESMIDDWKADNEEETKNLKIEEVETEEGNFVSYAHDEKYCYLLTSDNGNICINYISAR